MTLVTLAMGRSVSISRPHSTWPVAASASTAPLAFTPPGAPATWITGEADGRGGADVAGGRGRPSVTDGRGAAVEACMAAGCEPSPPAAGAHAVTPPAMTATTVSQTIRIRF